MAITINKNIRVTGEAPFVETFTISSPLVYVDNVVQTQFPEYSDYSFDIVYPDQSYIGTTSIIMNVTSNCGNAANYSINVISPCGLYSLGNIVKDAADPYRFSVLAANTTCNNAIFEWTYNKAIFEGKVTSRGLKSTLNLKLRAGIAVDLFNVTYSLSVKASDCKGCVDTSTASFSFCKASFDNVVKTVIPRDTTDLTFIYQQLGINGYYLSKPDGKLELATQLSTDPNQNKVISFGVNFNEFRSNLSCFLFDGKNVKFDILTTQYDIKYLGASNIAGSDFHMFVLHSSYESYYNTSKVVEIEFTITSNEGIPSYPAKVLVYPQSVVVDDISINFTDSEFNVKDGLISPLDLTTVNACSFTNGSVLYINPAINLVVSSNSYLNTTGATYGQNFFSTSESRLTVVPNPNAATSNAPFLFKFTFGNTVANTLPLTIPYTLYTTSKTDVNTKAYHSGNLTIKSLCSAAVTLTQNSVTRNLSCADYDDGTSDNIDYLDLVQYISGSYTPGTFPVEIVTLPTKGTFTINRNSTQVKYVAELCQHGTYTAEVKLRDINGVLSNTFTITYVVDCVGQDYYARFCLIE
jgi:hypothetical protein